VVEGVAARATAETKAVNLKHGARIQELQHHVPDIGGMRFWQQVLLAIKR
jgi:hypothetical protein